MPVDETDAPEFVSFIRFFVLFNSVSNQAGFVVVESLMFQKSGAKVRSFKGMIKFFAQKPPVVCNSASSYIRVFNPGKKFQLFSPASKTPENEKEIS